MEIKSHTLDLVISREDENLVHTLSVTSTGYCDHYVVKFTTPGDKEAMQQKCSSLEEWWKSQGGKKNK